MKYKVQIIRYEDDEVVEEMEAKGIRTAERIERGANINLNHDNFYTKIVDEEGNEVE